MREKERERYIYQKIHTDRETQRQGHLRNWSCNDKCIPLYSLFKVSFLPLVYSINISWAVTLCCTQRIQNLERKLVPLLSGTLVLEVVDDGDNGNDGGKAICRSYLTFCYARQCVKYNVLSALPTAIHFIPATPVGCTIIMIIPIFPYFQIKKLRYGEMKWTAQEESIARIWTWLFGLRIYPFWNHYTCRLYK